MQGEEGQEGQGWREKEPECLAGTHGGAVGALSLVCRGLELEVDIFWDSSAHDGIQKHETVSDPLWSV